MGRNDRSNGEGVMRWQGGCSGCPEGSFGCWPECRFPLVGWTSDGSDSEPPDWVVKWNDEMERRKREARR